MDIGNLTQYLWSWNSWSYSKLFISTNGRRHLNSCSAICFYNKSILFLLGVREIGNKGGGGGGGVDLSHPQLEEHTLPLTDIFHVFVKNFMFSWRISCFREEFHVFGKNSMFSGRIQCFREEFNVFGKNSMFSGKNSMFSGRIQCFREEFHVAICDTVYIFNLIMNPL